jgi:S1-C subfamily serine protease
LDFLTLEITGPYGDKLGLNPGDTIISAGGRTFKAEDDIEDFKLMIEGNPGGVLEVNVKRGSKIKTLSMKIPPDVLQKYGHTP